MNVSAEDLLGRVRALIDADEIAVAQWAPDPMLLIWLNTGVLKLWRKLARAGRVQPVTTSSSTAVSGTTGITIGGNLENLDAQAEPLIIYGVAEVQSNGYRQLRYGQSGMGPIPYALRGTTTGTPQVWWVSKSSLEGAYTINLSPPGTGTYEVTWLPKPLTLTDGNPLTGQTNQLDIPVGLEEYPVLYAARNAFARGGAAPPTMQRFLDEMDQELDTAAETFSQGNAPRVINKDHELRGWQRKGQDGAFGWQFGDWWWAP